MASSVAASKMWKLSMSKATSACWPTRRLERGIDAGNEGVLAADQVEEDFVTHQLGHIHFDGDLFRIDVGWDKVGRREYSPGGCRR